MNFCAMDLNQAQNHAFCHFLEFGSYIFYEIQYNDSLQQCLTSSRVKTQEKKIWGPKQVKIGPEIQCFAIFLGFVYQFFFKLHRVIAWNYELCQTISRDKTHGKLIFLGGGGKIGPEIKFFTIFSSLPQQFFFVLHRIAAWDNV